MASALSTAYEARLARGEISPDAAQAQAVAALSRLEADLAASEPNGLLSRFRKPESQRGVYLWGPVGRGKSMVMDLFYETAPAAKKRRTHFHVFMGEVHRLVDAWRKGDAAARKARFGQAKGDDPIPPVADVVAPQARLLCFDELQVTDIADAMILGRLFTALFRHGVVVVATSNVEPDRLYEGGLNRALFLPFVEALKDRVEVLRLDARADFRLEKIGGASVYHVPADEAAARALDEAFKGLTGRARGRPATLRVQGRDVPVPEEAAGVARFAFADLCAQPLGASDYMALARAFKTMIVEDIPIMGEANRNEAKRFITLIDTLYDFRVKLIASAAAEPQGLYTMTEGREAFEFDRTVSRLIEMRSSEYLALPHGRGDEASGSSAGLVET